MENDSAGNDEQGITLSDSAQPVTGDPKATADRLERVEAALGLLSTHLQTSTKGSELLEAEHSRSLLSSIAFGFSAIALIAMWAVDLAIEDDDVEIVGFTIGMSLLLLAAVIDLYSASLLRNAVHRAILEKEPSRLVLIQQNWKRVFQLDYWKTIRDKAPEFYRYQIMRTTALSVYIAAGIALIVSVITIN
ncbi:MAG: hypothetical protein HOC20_00195 [Chloroflexi bacterium]|jgi:hypothetical protein|nr:hypothetical protein [Chloroflexota bacterium]